MKERPILFNGPMVRALLDGSKTQTRRAVKLPHQNPLGVWEPGTIGGSTTTYADGTLAAERPCIWHTRTGDTLACPYGLVGDRLWVRESHQKIIGQSGGWIETDYRATYRHGDRLGDSMGIKKRWTPSIHMPRAVSRITLEIVSVRVERLQDISEADAIAEGLSAITKDGKTVKYGIPDLDGLPGSDDTGWSWTDWNMDPRKAYRRLWESINGHGSWDANPWCWAVEFNS